MRTTSPTTTPKSTLERPQQHMNETFCIFSAHYLPHVGGVEKYTQNLARELARRGDRVIIVTRHNKAYNRIMRYLHEQDIDYVTINTRFYRHTLEGIALAEAKGIRPVIVDHGSAHLTMGSKVVDPFVAAVEHAVTELVKRHPADYYAVSLAGKEWLRHFSIEACGVLNNSIDAQAFADSASHRSFRRELGLSDEKLVIAFTGRLIPEKGIPALIEAASILTSPAQRFRRLLPPLAFGRLLDLLAGSGRMRSNASRHECRRCAGASAK